MQIIMSISPKKLKAFIVFLTLLLISNSEMLGQQILNNIEVKLSISIDNNTDKEVFTVLFSVQNNLETEQKIGKYMTPFEGFKGDFIRVLNSKGNEMEYKGVNVKRSKPKDTDYMAIAPNSKIEISFNLFEVYEIPEKGKYTLQFSGNSYLNWLPDSNVLEIELN